MPTKLCWLTLSLVKNGAGVVQAILYVVASIIVCPCLSHLLFDSIAHQM